MPEFIVYEENKSQRTKKRQKKLKKKKKENHNELSIHQSQYLIKVSI